MPAFGQSGSSHLEMGVGAVLNYTLIPLFERDIFDLPPGPNAILIRFRPGVSAAQGEKSIQHAVDQAGGGGGNSPNDLVQLRGTAGADSRLSLPRRHANRTRRGTFRRCAHRPRSHTAVLGSSTSSRHRLAESTRILASSSDRDHRRPVHHRGRTGRSRWAAAGNPDRTNSLGPFANSIHAIPHVVVPTATLLIIAGVSLVLANLIAALPARLAAQTSPAILLRAE